MQREITLTRAIAWIASFVGATAALSCASLLFIADREEPAAVFASGGFVLLLWAALRLAEPAAT